MKSVSKKGVADPSGLQLLNKIIRLPWLPRQDDNTCFQQLIGLFGYSPSSVTA